MGAMIWTLRATDVQSMTISFVIEGGWEISWYIVVNMLSVHVHLKVSRESFPCSTLYLDKIISQLKLLLSDFWKTRLDVRSSSHYVFQNVVEHVTSYYLMKDYFFQVAQSKLNKTAAIKK